MNIPSTQSNNISTTIYNDVPLFISRSAMLLLGIVGIVFALGLVIKTMRKWSNDQQVKDLTKPDNTNNTLQDTPETRLVKRIQTISKDLMSEIHTRCPQNEIDSMKIYVTTTLNGQSKYQECLIYFQDGNLKSNEPSKALVSRNDNQAINNKTSDILNVSFKNIPKTDTDIAKIGIHVLLFKTNSNTMYHFNADEVRKTGKNTLEWLYSIGSSTIINGLENDFIQNMFGEMGREYTPQLSDKGKFIEPVSL